MGLERTSLYVDDERGSSGDERGYVETSPVSLDEKSVCARNQHHRQA
jgi:hypothetical protein